MIRALLSVLGFGAATADASKQSHANPAEAAGRMALSPLQLAPGVPDMPPTSDQDPLDDVPRYPPFDQGMPVKDVARVLQSQADLIAQIYRTAGVSKAEFKERYEQPIENLARYVHLLPATDTDHHTGGGGLFCFALQIGLYSLQMANASIFPVGGGVERRYHMAPKWSLATFLAAICSQLYRTVGSMVVLSRDHEQWQPLLVPLFDWAHANGTDRYFIRWLEQTDHASSQASSAFVVNQIVPASVMQYLSLDNNLVLGAMSSAIAGGSTGDNPILRIINPITTRVQLEDRKRSSRNYGHLMVGSHLEPHILDAMRRLIRRGTWTWNHKHAVLWIGTDGVFLCWAQAVDQIVSHLVREGYAGIPKDPTTIAQMLVKSQVLQLQPDGSTFWTISPPEANQVLDEVVRIATPEQLFPTGFDWKSMASVDVMVGARTEVGDTSAGKPTQRKSQPKPAVPPVLEEVVVVDQPMATADEPAESDTYHEGSPPPDWDQIPLPVESPPDEPGHSEVAVSPSPNVTPLPAHGKGERKVREQRRSPPSQGETTKPKQAASSGTLTLDSNGEPILPGNNAARLAGMLKKENARLLKDIYAAAVSKKLKGIVTYLPNGLGISHEELMGHGRPAMDFIQDLADKQWLWIDKTKPTRNVHTVQIGQTNYRMLILKPDIALGLGFSESEVGRAA